MYLSRPNIPLYLIILYVEAIEAPKQFGDSCELEAFREHLEFHHLKYAIVIRTKENEFWRKHFTSLTSQYYVRFLNADNSTQKDFNQNFLNGIAPRVGLFMRFTVTDQAKLNILLSVSKDAMFNYSLSWFIVMEDNAGGHLEIMRHNFGHLNVMLNADVTVVIHRGICNLDLYDIYKVCNKCDIPMEIEHKGKWTEGSGLKIWEKFRDSYVRRRGNFRNTTVKTATALLNYSPHLNVTIHDYLNDNKHFLQNDFMQRKTYQLMKLTQSLYNLSFDLHIQNAWGARRNTTWTGVLGMVTTKAVDFSLCPFRFTHERMSAIQYSPVLHVETLRFLFRRPKRVTIRNIFFQPLADNVWWGVLALIVTAASLLAIHIRAECKLYGSCRKGCRRSHGDVKQSTETNLAYVVFTVLETVFMQGPLLEQFRSNSTRILLTSVSVFSIILMQFYGAFIVSSLLSEPPRSISTLAALYNSSLEIGMENISYNFEIFNTATNPVVRDIYKNRICRNGIPRAMTLEDGMQSVAQGGFAMHVSLDRAYRFLENILTESQFCDLEEIAFNTPFVTCLAMEKSSPYRKFISVAILKYRETSLLQHNDKQWKIKKIDCAAIKNNKVEVDLDHFAPVLVFLALGILVATTIFSMENLHKCIMRKIDISFENICKTMCKYLKIK